MRSAVDLILRWHRSIESSDLARKFDKITRTPFRFFRGTFFLFTQDLNTGFRRPRPLEIAGRVIGDLHTENYGTFRSTNGSIVYDINDFDETTIAPYEYDMRRLAVSLILAAQENTHRLGDGLNAAESAIRNWIESLQQWSGLQRRDFEKLPLTGAAYNLLQEAHIIDRAQFLAALVNPSGTGGYLFKPSQTYHRVDQKVSDLVAKGVPFFWKHCTAPKTARVDKYRLLDVAHRVAGNGSLGRERLALLFDNGTRKSDFSQLRLIEWKQSLDSAIDSTKPHCAKRRSRDIYNAELAFQLYPKRYLGFTTVGKMQVQGREVGANDTRFDHTHFAELKRFEQAAAMFGQILARAHLLAANGRGPRDIPKKTVTRTDRYVNSILRFASDYAGQVHDDFEELRRNSGRLEKAWKK